MAKSLLKSCTFQQLMLLLHLALPAYGASTNLCHSLFKSDETALSPIQKDPSLHLQDASNKVAAQIFKHFGYRFENTPPAGSRPANLTQVNSFQSRQLRLVSALLNDRTIEENPSVLWQTPEGELVITKLTRSLGFFPAKTLSSGKIRAYNVEDFRATQNIFGVTEFVNFRLPENHVWRLINQEDAWEFVQNLRNLSNNELQIAVNQGNYANTSDRNHILNTLIIRRDTLISHLLELFPKLDPHAPAEIIVEQLRLDQLPHLTQRLDRIGFLISQNQGRFVDQLRQPLKERVLRADKLSATATKFRKLTDEQVYAQWGGHSELNLNSDPKTNYLSKTTRLKRGDHIHLTRTILLTRKQLLELLTTKLFASHFLYVFNYDVHLLKEVYKLIGNPTTHDLIDHNIGSGGTAIPTTYAVDGYTKTRYTNLLIHDEASDNFNLQVHFSVPVEAIVTVDPTRLPPHVANEPSGFGFLSAQADKESEISFFDLIPREFIATDFNVLQTQVATKTYSQQKINPTTGQYD